MPHPYGRESADLLRRNGENLEWRTCEMEYSVCLDEIRDIAIPPGFGTPDRQPARAGAMMCRAGKYVRYRAGSRVRSESPDTAAWAPM